MATSDKNENKIISTNEVLKQLTTSYWLENHQLHYL